ncbi:AAA family ATPase-like protein [Coleophoma cylindrospora]|uniref:AAA family ATPase-like protein n=1 Tax=Coleophoma cylindrospora TaxID=1849047 RepID=A0A3D8RSQ6_9HELO|nr:AAA family ATPase-like protein [Coleophoma cylindrospora]
MSSLITSEKTLEVKIRPFSSGVQERADQKGVARVNLCKESLLDLRLESGQPCFLWKEGGQKREAIAWLTAEKSLSKKVIQVAKTFQEVCGFKLGDDVFISAAGSLASAENITLRDMSATEVDGVSDLSPEERPHWEWFLEESLARAEIIFPGMSFKNLSLRGPRRSFKVESVNGKTNGVAKFETASSVRIASQEDVVAETQVIGSAKLSLINIAGIDQALSKLNRFLKNFDKQFELPWGPRSCAVLVHGGHGSGKSFILDKIASTGWGKVHKIRSDAKPDAIRSVFKDARMSQPSIVLIDKLDSLLSKDGTGDALGEELDNLASTCTTSMSRVIVAAATLDASTVPLDLRSETRFNTEIVLPVPDATARKQILKSLAPPVQPESYDEILESLGDRTHAYTARDLVSLLVEARNIAEDKLGSEPAMDTVYITRDDLEQALLAVRPTAMHDITLKPPSVRWHEIGGQDGIKKALQRAVETPLTHPDRMKRVGISPTKGLLLYGPPGCSKTLSAQAMATEIGFNFFAVKGAELLNMYVGESERAVRNIFARARAASPSIIFFDEIESIGGKRESGGRSSGVNVLTTLLNEMDGIETLKGVTVLAATNQPEALDLALLRPGRFDKLLYVAPPDSTGREEILRVRQRKMDWASDVDIHTLVTKTDGFSGAEIVGICQTAGDTCMDRCALTGQEEQISMEDFLNAIDSVKMQITPEMIQGYEDWARGARGDSV